MFVFRQLKRTIALLLSLLPMQAQHISIPPAPLDAMIPMFHKWQMADAVRYVERADALGHKRVQFCIALQAELDASHKVQTIGLYRDNREAGKPNALYPYDNEIHTELFGYLRDCFRAAENKGIKISVLLHLNSHGAINEWRNNFDFDPLLPLQGVSYENGYFSTVMKALEESISADHPAEISVQGEMGKTVFLYPGSWKKLIENTRSKSKLKNARYGLSFNYQGVAGTAPLTDEKKEQLKSLWGVCDFIGISMYQGVSLPPQASDFDLALGLFLGEFYARGCPLPVDKDIHFVEVGLGGGGLSSTDWQNHIPAKKAADAARSPYLGAAIETKINPWNTQDLNDLRIGYHEALCEFLSQPRSRHTVTQAFLWNFGSWDPLGIENDTFADPQIKAVVKSHNVQIHPTKKTTKPDSPTLPPLDEG